MRLIFDPIRTLYSHSHFWWYHVFFLLLLYLMLLFSTNTLITSKLLNFACEPRIRSFINFAQINGSRTKKKNYPYAWCMHRDQMMRKKMKIGSSIEGLWKSSKLFVCCQPRLLWYVFVLLNIIVVERSSTFPYFWHNVHNNYHIIFHFFPSTLSTILFCICIRFFITLCHCSCQYVWNAFVCSFSLAFFVTLVDSFLLAYSLLLIKVTK